MKQLDVFWDDVLTGYLREHDDGQITFSYHKDWIKTPNAAALSPGLPLAEQEYSGRWVISYFDNLLPEGSIRKFIAQAAKISEDNVFALLERFGGDMAGALTLLPQGLQPTREPRYLSVTPDMIHQWFTSSKGIPLNIQGLQARISLSGAQEKMTVFISPSGELSIPLGDAPSSHIIKPSIGRHAPQTAINETLIMRLAAAVHLDVPKVHYDPELDAVIVTRYDRELGTDGQLRRLQQNDFCQTLGLTPGRKYESEGGPTFKDCVDVVMQHSSRPALDKKRLLEWLVFNIIVGNMDSHAKNLSLLFKDGQKRLAPFYDMVCTTVYESLSDHFAFRIGGENRPEWMMERHWEQFARDIGATLRFIQFTRKELSEQIMFALPGVADELRQSVRSQESLKMIDQVVASIQRSARRWIFRMDAAVAASREQTANSNKSVSDHHKQANRQVPSRKSLK